MCLQLFSPKCFRKLYPRPCSDVNCNYLHSINETETQETKLLLKLAVHGIKLDVSFALPSPSFLSERQDRAASEVCRPANILLGHIKGFGKQMKYLFSMRHVLRLLILSESTGL